MWILFALGSAFFAGMTAILAKIGIKKTDSTVATAIRTIIVLIFTWLMVFIVGSQKELSQISGRTHLFLTLSGLATGASWLCYFKALQLGRIDKVTPVDKSSVVLTMLFAMLFLGEPFTWIKWLAIVLISTGTYLMIMKQKPDAGKPGSKVETKDDKVSIKTAEARQDSGLWFPFAALSAAFAALTAILGKAGIQGVESNLGTALRTIVVLVMAWMMVFVTGKAHELKEVDKRSWLFIVLSGFATGASWLCYYRALKDGPASVVVPIDKLSILVTIAASVFIFHEKVEKRAWLGLALIIAGTLMLLIK